MAERGLLTRQAGPIGNDAGDSVDWSVPARYDRLEGLRGWRLAVARACGAATILFGVSFVAWRFTVEPKTPPALLFWLIEMVACAGIVLTVWALWSPRVRDSPSGMPEGTLDVLLPVCGEPIAMIDATVRAALAIRYPHRVVLLNDGRIANKENWREVEALACRCGVRCITRANGKRGKAGNLNAGLAAGTSDFIAVFDADHTADPAFGHEALGYFSDPEVAVVTTPQLFHLDGKDVLHNAVPFFYGYMMPAKDVANAAFSCGNATAYRRAALEQIGGFSEWNLGEDLYTTYELHARGWKSVYHPRPLSIGTAPRTAAALAIQRLRYAVDSLRVLFFDSPLRKPGLTARQRLHYLQTTSSYLFGVAQAIFLVAPAILLLWQSVLLGASTPPVAYAVHAAPYYLAEAAFVITYVGPANALSMTSQWLFLSPVFAYGAMKAFLCDRHVGTRTYAKVTEKARQVRFSWLLLPTVLAFGMTMLALLVADLAHRSPSPPAVFFAVVVVILLSRLISATVAAKHARLAEVLIGCAVAIMVSVYVTRLVT